LGGVKISVDRSHPAFHEWAPRVCRFYLGGVERNNVLFADEERRFAITRRLGDAGEDMYDREGNLLTDEFRGIVRIDCPDWLREEMESGDDKPPHLDLAG
jgi:hypothetical protein